MTTVSAPRLQALRDVFGDVLPKDAGAAIRMLEQSPALAARPLMSAAERLSLREAVIQLAGQRLPTAPAGPRSAPSSTTSRPLPAAMALRLQEATRARAQPGRTADGLAAVQTLDGARGICARAAAMPDVPWTFLEEGCIHRAHVLAKRLEDDGIWSEKIFAIPVGGEDLVMETAKARLGYTVVWFHVANVVHVTEADGRRGRRVIDPSVADEPLTIEAWEASMHGAKGGGLETFFLPRFACGLDDRDGPPAAWREKDLDAAFAWNEEAPLVLQDYVRTGFYDEVAKLAGRPPAASTKITDAA